MFIEYARTDLSIYNLLQVSGPPLPSGELDLLRVLLSHSPASTTIEVSSLEGPNQDVVLSMISTSLTLILWYVSD